MPTLTVTKNYSANNVLTQAQLDAAFESIETFLNTTQIDDDNIQSAGVGSDSIASNAITTAKINANAVTRAKLEAVGQQIASSDSGTFNSTNTSYIDVTNATVTITTTGRPVFIFCQSSGSLSYIGVSSTTVNNTPDGSFKIVRDSTDIAEIRYLGAASSFTTNFLLPPGAIMHLDTPSAGTYTYKLQAKSSASTDRVFAEEVILVAFEL